MAEAAAEYLCVYYRPCYAMLCYAMLCYAMLCYAMLCYASRDMKLTQLLERCRENIKLNKEKLRWKRSDVSYMGHLITAKGLKVDPAKVEAILKMPQPLDKRAVQRLLGMVNYLQKFAKGISTARSHQRRH